MLTASKSFPDHAIKSPCDAGAAGGYYPWAPPSGAGYVDIDDVAAAHTLAMVTPKASGR